MCIKIYNRNLDASWPAFNGGETTSGWHVTLSLVYIYIYNIHTCIRICTYVSTVHARVIRSISSLIDPSRRGFTTIEVLIQV